MIQKAADKAAEKMERESDKTTPVTNQRLIERQDSRSSGRAKRHWRSSVEFMSKGGAEKFTLKLS
jgi:hypothetical protein